CTHGGPSFETRYSVQRIRLPRILSHAARRGGSSVTSKHWPFRFDQIPKAGISGNALAALLRFRECPLLVDTHHRAVFPDDAAVADHRIGSPSCREDEASRGQLSGL